MSDLLLALLDLGIHGSATLPSLAERWESGFDRDTASSSCVWIYDHFITADSGHTYKEQHDCSSPERHIHCTVENEMKGEVNRL